MNIIVAPDSFKGSLTSLEAGSAIKKGVLSEIPQANIEVIPMADGGEGTLSTLLFATKGSRFKVDVMGPLGKRVETQYGVLGNGDTVVIEMALISGLPMVPEGQRNPLYTTTFGIGEVILEAINSGYRKFIIGLGGSATNDGGLGMLQALGVTFLNDYGHSVRPFGESVSEVTIVDYSTLDSRVKECSFQIASDVENPLCGPNGASAVFGPQKGADQEIVQFLDKALSKFASLVEKEIKTSFAEVEGAGAAGGLGFAFLTIGGEIVSGAKLIGEATGLKDKILKSDLVITGEGQSDFQTLFGKVPGYIGKLAFEQNVNAVLISGSLGKGYEKLYDYFLSCDSISTGPMSLQESMLNAEELLYKKAKNLARLLAR
ncbi:glycerate kinase [Bacillus mesophilus]|uniref:Glycerate kinase n=1 Tax=Bacillus mesophilus TaxID=1808955 RepID=A0A6M0QBF2_9BACI|nr:glycerate kinase [Bacillus mesophilus]MBM7663016.1 glycerate kinase [Bacillus mesophilus]NEY73662.1 glycerate kinase [Bacillus mesophilus]